MDYNLMEEKWIPVLWKEGSTGRVGIREAFEKASAIRQIAVASPLDLFAVHRFLLTLLYWKAPLAGGVGQLRQSLLVSEKVPKPVLDGIEAEAQCFNLFDEKRPFLQDPSVRSTGGEPDQPVGKLFAELATGTNKAHFQHGDDEALRLCIPCTTLGMLRVIPWSQPGGRGLSPSIHNAPPIMTLASGDSLALTLRLNLVPLTPSPGEPSWSGRFTPNDTSKPVPYLEAFTWNPRRIYLPQPVKGDCWYCGQKNVDTVGPKMVFKNNVTTKRREKGAKKVPFIWNDPSAFYERGQYEPEQSAGESGARDGEDLKKLVSSSSIVASTNQEHRGWRVVIPCTDKRNKTFDHRELGLPTLSSETVKALLPPPRTSWRQTAFDGWKIPGSPCPQAIMLFVRSATRLFTYSDWTALANAAYCDMHDAPAAFDVFAGLYGGLGGRKAPGMPSRNAAWLTLKLMAAVPAHLRAVRPGARFRPLERLPKRQPDELGRRSAYPISFPRGERLEALLRGELDANSRRQNPQRVDWFGLCHGLDEMLD